MKVWDAVSRQHVMTVSKHTGYPEDWPPWNIGRGDVVVAPGGDLLAGLVQGAFLVLWDMASGRDVACVKVYADDRFPSLTSAPVFSPDGGRLATISKEYSSDGKAIPSATVRLWDVTFARQAARSASVLQAALRGLS